MSRLCLGPKSVSRQSKSKQSLFYPLRVHHIFKDIYIIHIYNSFSMSYFNLPPEYDAHSFPVGQEAASQGSPSEHSPDAKKRYWTTNNQQQGQCPRMRDLDIFRHMISTEDQVMLLAKLRLLYFNVYPCPVPTPLIPDLEMLTRRCLIWITNDEPVTQDTSIIALLTSKHFAVALQGYIDPTITSTLQHFLLSTSLTYTSWRDRNPPSQRLSVRDLQRLSHLTGSALLHKLDGLLDPETFTRSSKPILQALFLVLFGTMLGITYSTSAGSGPPEIRTDLLSKVLRESPTLWMAMRERLCQLLANSLITLANMINLQFDKEAVKNNILEGCLMGRWNRTGRWVWADAVLPPWQQRWSTEGANRPGGIFFPTPQPAMVPCPEVLSPLLPNMDGSDGRKRRSMIVVGPSRDGQQIYARMRTHTGSDGPSLFI
ncbi:hypothetical protein VM1G_11630 [Cytospora mali]|uniref:Uncharacterized protein n=1 Tax=Cytospora mali TaxID=578113 RepID=A0A194W0Y5_CYTMA|nr:hypothetical protein VM1G_11630 [Valsa mali]